MKGDVTAAANLLSEWIRQDASLRAVIIQPLLTAWVRKHVEKEAAQVSEEHTITPELSVIIQREVAKALAEAEKAKLNQSPGDPIRSSRANRRNARRPPRVHRFAEWPTPTASALSRGPGVTSVLASDALPRENDVSIREATPQTHAFFSSNPRAGPWWRAEPN
jgi:hypothetical protein